MLCNNTTMQQRPSKQLPTEMSFNTFFKKLDSELLFSFYTVPELSKWAKRSAKRRQAGVSVMSTFLCSHCLSGVQTADMRHVANWRLSAKCKQQKTAPCRHAHCFVKLLLFKFTKIFCVPQCCLLNSHFDVKKARHLLQSSRPNSL